MQILLYQKVGAFFIGYNKDGEKVSFGYYTDGGVDKSHKRLLYFAVKEKHRKQNYGYQTLRKVIEEKINLDSGCMLACNKDVKKFYGKLGFKFKDIANLGKFKLSFNPLNEITMVLCSDKCNTEEENFGKFKEARMSMALVPELIELQIKYKISHLITPETIKMIQLTEVERYLSENSKT